MKIALISCVSQKAPKPCAARDLYVSALFKKHLQYAERILKPDKTFILSALYGLVELDQIIEPYDKTLLKMSKGEIKAWGVGVWKALEKVSDIKQDTFIMLAGSAYVKPLTPYLRNIEEPFKGMRIGERLQALTAGLNSHLAK